MQNSDKRGGDQLPRHHHASKLLMRFATSQPERIQPRMIGLQKYVGTSAVAASAVIYHAFYTREQ